MEAGIAWYLSLVSPDRVKALVNLSIARLLRNPEIKFVEGFTALYGDDYYFCRFQVPGEAEEDFASDDTKTLLKKIFTSLPRPLITPKQIGFRGLKAPETLPFWLSEDDINLNYYAAKFNKIGFPGGLNYYRSFDLTWYLTWAWTGPVKFKIGDQDMFYVNPGIKEYIYTRGGLEQVVVMEGVAHFINQEKPHKITTHIYDFISKF